MRRNERWRAVAIAGSIVLEGVAGAADTADTHSVVLHVHDRASVPAEDLDRARIEVEGVLRNAGVGMTWVAGPWPPVENSPEPEGAGIRRIGVTLVNIENERTAPPRTTGCALGVAVPSRGTAIVFYNRILAATRARPVDTRVVLGRVIAHEVGHLLLPPGRHARYGIMREDLDFGVKNPGRFTGDEANAIQAALTRR